MRRHPNQFYGYDLATKKVGGYNPGSGGLWPRLDRPSARMGTVYGESGDGEHAGTADLRAGLIGVKQNPETKAWN